MKTEIEIADRITQLKERVQEMIDEPYNPHQPQLTNVMCLASEIDALKWVLYNNE